MTSQLRTLRGLPRGLSSLVLTMAMALLVTAPPATRAGEFSDAFRTLLDEADPRRPVTGIVVLADRFDPTWAREEMERRGLTSRWRQHRFTLDTAREMAAHTQRSLVAELESRRDRGEVIAYRPFWVVNAVVLTAVPEVFHTLITRGEVETVHPDTQLELRTGPSVDGHVSPRDPRQTNESALDAINVQVAWARGYTGTDRLICLFDDGADGDHEAYGDRWRGARAEVPWYHAWKDPVSGSDFPDGGVHGTPVLGIMTADPPTEDPFGVAHEAEWMAGAVLDPQITLAQILDLYEWAADPDSNASTVDDVPDVINNSWGSSGDCATELWDAIDVVEAAGVVNVIAVDNAGPSEGSVNSPESRADTPYQNFSVGNVDTNDPAWPIATSSARGPSLCPGVPPHLRIKPELTAPGTFLRSTFPNDTYSFSSGTSIAAPFVSGAAAILRQVNSDLTADQIKYILMLTAQDLGDPGEDNTYGWGLLDIGSAVHTALAMATPRRPPNRVDASSIGADVARVTWEHPITSDQSVTVTGYQIFRAGADGVFGSSPAGSVGPDTFAFDDSPLPPGAYLYAVTALYPEGESGPSEIARATVSRLNLDDPRADEGPAQTPTATGFLDGRPNPFHPLTVLRFELPATGPARITIHDVGGRVVRAFDVPAGEARGEIVWDGRDAGGREVPAGVYFARLEQDGRRLDRRLVRYR